MNAREELIQRVREGGSYKLININGQVGRDGKIYSDTPPAAGVKGHANLRAVEEVDKQRYPYLWKEQDLGAPALIIQEREPTPEELAAPYTIWIGGKPME